MRVTAFSEIAIETPVLTLNDKSKDDIFLFISKELVKPINKGSKTDII